MAFDFKKENKNLYAPKTKPEMIHVPSMKFLAVRGKGSPREQDGDYHKAIRLLYGVAYTLRMSYKGERRIPGFFEYVVPPLEGFWWQPNVRGVDYSTMESFEWISLIRIPDFISEEDVIWGINTVSKKKNEDYSKVQYFEYEEGLCVQCMHIGPYVEELATTQKMEQFMLESGYEYDFSDIRHHHEIYLSDPNKSAPDKLKTILRHPVKKAITD